MVSNTVHTEYIVTVGRSNEGRQGTLFFSKESHVFVGELCENHNPKVSLQNLYKKEIIMTLNLCP